MEQTAAKKSIPMLLMKSLLASYVLTALLLFLLAFLLYKFDLGESKVNLGITVIYILSCFLGGFLVGKGAGTRKFLWGMVLGAIYAADVYKRQTSDCWWEMRKQRYPGYFLPWM